MSNFDINTDIFKKAIKELGETALEIFKAVLSSKAGINKKVGKNTLIDSDLYKSAEVVIGADFIKILVNSYYDYIETGMRVGVFVPIDVIVKWASRKGMSLDNNKAFAIQRAIYRDGIAPRNLSAPLEREIKKYFNEWCNNLFNEWINTLTDNFNNS